MSDTPQNNDIRDAAALGASTAEHVQDVLDGKAVLVPKDWRVEDTEAYEKRPRRVHETVKAETLSGFLGYLRRYHFSDTTLIFASPHTPSFEAVFDYHSPDKGPRWGDHTCRFRPDESDRMDVWTHNSGRMMSQMDFAEHIEENAEDVIDPDPARILEIATQFEATRNVQFKSVERLSGVSDLQFHYEEETSGKGDLQIPERLEIGIPVFKGMAGWKITARLRWRLTQNEIKIGYKLLSLARTRREAAQALVDQVEEVAEELSLPIFEARRMR
jgi:uncharacterized protein YfdQ (DUF2303 family)